MHNQTTQLWGWKPSTKLPAFHTMFGNHVISASNEGLLMNKNSLWINSTIPVPEAMTGNKPILNLVIADNKLPCTLCVPLYVCVIIIIIIIIIYYFSLGRGRNCRKRRRAGGYLV